jgi:hypothetical protein
MLNLIRGQECNMNAAQVCAPKPDDRWQRDMKEDMKSAIDLLWKFKLDLDKLHPEVMMIIENMLQNNQRRY